MNKSKLLKSIFMMVLIVAVSVMSSGVAFAQLNNTPVSSSPSLLQNLMAYDASGNLEYVGYAAKGTAEGIAEWTLYKLTYNVSNKITSKKTAFGSWTLREGYSYE